ncbi:MAG: hypothetical protein Tsb009_26320 [Planctomycetaceae bacterium]
MSNPLLKTVEFLANSRNPKAFEVLVAALDLEGPAQDLVVETILKRNHSRAHIEVLNRLESIGEQSRALVEENSVRLAPAIQQVLLNGTSTQQAAVADLILATERFEHLESLLKLLVGVNRESAPWLAPAFEQLTNLLFDHCRPFSDARKTGKYLRHAAQVQTNMLNSLDQAWRKVEDRETLELLWETILVLGTTENAAVKKLLEQAKEDVREAAWEILTISTRPGVMQLLCDFLGHASPPRTVFRIVGQRSDPEFISFLLRWLPDPLTPKQQKNLEAIDSVTWLNGTNDKLPELPPGLHESLVRFVGALGLQRDEKIRIFEWLIHNGSLEARLAATDALASQGKETVQEMLYESLESDDEEVQAWATGQLRQQGVPQAVPLLLDRLDSPLEDVREAAREELHSFNLYQMLELFEDVSHKACLEAGEVIQKIDPLTIRKLNAELRNPIQRRRLRAIRGAFAMGLHTQVVPTLISLLHDEDEIVRRAAIDVLSHVAEPDVISALTSLRDDPSPRIRDHVERGLKRLSQLMEEDAQTTSNHP